MSSNAHMVVSWTASVKALVSLLENAMNSLAPTIYPSLIARACSALDESLIFKEMPDGFIRVILRIIKKINLSSPCSQIFASRGTISKESGKSIETVQRAIRWMECEGLIEREQVANPGQRGSKSPLTPTRKFLAAIGLLDPQPSTARAHQGGSAAPSRSDSGLELGGSPAAEQEHTRPSSFVRFGTLTLPADLAWLCTSNGLRATGVLQLMRTAREAKQRLSDVVAATKQYLEKLSGRQLYAYIRSLLTTGKDFSFISREIHENGAISQAEEYLREKAEILDGRTFSNRDQSVHIHIANGVLEVQRGGQRSIAFMSQKFIDAIEAGRMREVWGSASALGLND